MGCCENRDEEALRKQFDKFDSEKGKSRKRSSIGKMKEQDLIVFSDRSQFIKSLYKGDGETSLRMYIEWCRSLKKWNEMVEYIGDFTPIGESQVSIEGASSPKTVAGLIVVYLDIELRQYQGRVLVIIESTIFDMVRIMANGTKDFNENATFLILDFLEYASDFVIKKLASLGIFSVLFNVYSETTEKNIIKICSLMIRDREFLKKMFFQSNGAEIIMKRILSCQKNLGDLNEVIELIQILAYRDSGEIDYHSVCILKKWKILDFLHENNHCKTVKKLWNVLSNDKVLIM